MLRSDEQTRLKRRLRAYLLQTLQTRDNIRRPNDAGRFVAAVNRHKRKTFILFYNIPRDSEVYARY